MGHYFITGHQSREGVLHTKRYPTVQEDYTGIKGLCFNKCLKANFRWFHFFRGAIRELRQQRWRRLRKSHSKNEFALLQALSCSFQLVRFVKCWEIFLELNSKRLYRSSGKEKESRCLVFTSSTNRKIKHFHVVVVQRRQRNVQESVMHLQSCSFANQTYCFFAVLVAVAVVVA